MMKTVNDEFHIGTFGKQLWLFAGEDPVFPISTVQEAYFKNLVDLRASRIPSIEVKVTDRPKDRPIFEPKTDWTANSYDWTPVVSSNIEKVKYNASHRELFVTFHSGDCYVYYDVPSRISQEFLNAESQGRYLNQEIKPSYLGEKQ